MPALASVVPRVLIEHDIRAEEHTHFDAGDLDERELARTWVIPSTLVVARREGHVTLRIEVSIALSPSEVEARVPTHAIDDGDTQPFFDFSYMPEDWGVPAEQSKGATDPKAKMVAVS